MSPYYRTIGDPSGQIRNIFIKMSSEKDNDSNDTRVATIDNPNPLPKIDLLISKSVIHKVSKLNFKQSGFKTKRLEFWKN